jgi:cytochrome c553
MNTMAKNLSDQDIALVAAYFSGIGITVKAP